MEGVLAEATKGAVTGVAPRRSLALVGVEDEAEQSVDPYTTYVAKFQALKSASRYGANTWNRRRLS